MDNWILTPAGRINSRHWSLFNWLKTSAFPNVLIASGESQITNTYTTHNTLDLSQGRIHADSDQLVIFLDALSCFGSLTTVALGKTPKKRNQRMKTLKEMPGGTIGSHKFSSVPVCVVKEMLFVPRLNHENLSDSLNAALYYYDTAF